MDKNTSMEEHAWDFCKHDIAHLLDVARIAYIMNLEKNMGINKELIYAAALLHDITKWKQIAGGGPHNESAVAPARLILTETGFSPHEIEIVLDAILHHRKGPDKNSKAYDFSRLIYKADKKSRACYMCPYDKMSCNWAHMNNKLRL